MRHPAVDKDLQIADVNIAFANELSLICDDLDINVWELIALANRHPRVNILRPGPGVGGHCIAVDPWFIVSSAPDRARLIKTAREVNDAKPEWVIEQARSSLGEYLQKNPGKTAQDVTIACLGLAFKPDIDDLRESPSLEIALELARQHPGPVVAIEPNIRELPAGLPECLQLVAWSEILSKPTIALILVNHRAFQEIPKQFWDDVLVIDACGMSASQ